MSERSGLDVVFEVLRTEGVRHLFGNPGSTELPLIDGLSTADDLGYVLALQEATVVGMADGYAQATRRPSFVNLHTSAGLGNAIGNLTNAVANNTPLVVTAGQQDWRHIHYEPLLSGELTGIAGPVAKWSHEVRTLAELGTVLRRAFHDAATAPSGPVFVSIPMDVLEQRGEIDAPPRSNVGRAAIPEGLGQLAELLATTPVGRLALVAGDEVAAADAVDEVVALAEALGAPVYGAPLYGTAVFPPTHPLWAGMLAPMAMAVAGTLGNFDRILYVGGKAFLVYPYTPGPAVPASVELLHPDPAQLGRHYPTRLGLAGDPKATLAALTPLVRDKVDTGAVTAALDAARARRTDDLESFEAMARDRYDTVPMDPMAASHALVRSLPAGAAVVDEAITTGIYVRGFHHNAVPDGYFFCRGGGLGWGMPAACGVSLGRDRAPVLCAVGDGSALYSPQALWTAAREQLPVVFAVLNNRQYRILKENLRGRGGPSAKTGRFVAMDIDQPPVDFVALGRSFGVDGLLVEKATDVGDAVRAAFEAGGPFVLELPIAAP